MPQKGRFRRGQFPRHRGRADGGAKARCRTLPALFDRIDSLPVVAQTPLPGLTPRRPTRCRAGIPARNCWQSNSRCRPRHPVFRWSIGTPTMPIGPHDHNLTPPTAMLRHFLNKRLRLYLDFIVNLVDVRDVASGLVLAMERGQVGHRYILGGESIPLKQILQSMSAISGRRSLDIAVPGAIAAKAAAVLEFIADHVTRPTAIGDRRRGQDRAAGDGTVDRKGQARTGLRAAPDRARPAGDHRLSSRDLRPSASGPDPRYLPGSPRPCHLRRRRNQDYSSTCRTIQILRFSGVAGPPPGPRS